MPYHSLKKRHALLLSVISLLVAIIVPAICLADAGKIFRENNKAVVFIKTFDEAGKGISQGSGFIVRRDGVIVTNYHVVRNASSITIKAGIKVFNVDGLIYIDKENDIAILKVGAKNLPIVKLGNLEKTDIGEKVYVISSPEGFENTISDGILSSKREIGPNKIILQITAPISHGSSGGPVFNKDGEVIGIASAFWKEGQNINFARPLDVIKNKITSNKVTAIKKYKIDDYKKIPESKEVIENEKTAEYWFSLGFAYSEAGNYKDAVEAYKQAIHIKPDFAMAYNHLGVAYSNLGIPQKAIEAYQRVYVINIDYALAYNDLGYTLDEHKLYQDTIETFKQAISINPDDAVAFNNLGFSYSKIGRYQEAVEAHKHAIRIKPSYEEAYNGLGIAYDALGDYQEAVEAYKQAIRIKADYAVAYNNLGATFSKLRRYQETVEAYKQAIRIKPDDAEAYKNLGSAYCDLGRYQEAVEAYKQAIRIKPDFTAAYMGLGLTYVFLKDTEAAMEQYKVLKKLNTGDAEQLFNWINR